MGQLIVTPDCSHILVILVFLNGCTKKTRTKKKFLFLQSTEHVLSQYMWWKHIILIIIKGLLLTSAETWQTLRMSNQKSAPVDRWVWFLEIYTHLKESSFTLEDSFPLVSTSSHVYFVFTADRLWPWLSLCSV